MTPGRPVAGTFATTPDQVYDAYRPRAEYVSSVSWQAVRPLAVSACRKAEHSSVDAALSGIRIASHFLDWCRREGIPLAAETAFSPPSVERYIATQTGHLTAATRATHRSHLRRIGRAATRSAPWPNKARPYARPNAMTSPYSDREVADFAAAVDQQPTETLAHRLGAFLCLGLGAGLRPGEMLTVHADEHLGIHPDDPNLWIVFLADRMVPVRRDYVPLLRRLSRVHPTGPLVGPHNPETKNPVGILTQGLLFPATAPPLRLFRLRITWMKAILDGGTRLPEFAALAGVASAKTLETIIPHLAGRWEDDEWLRKASES